MAITSLVTDPRTGLWYHNVAKINPYSFDVLVSFTPESGDTVPFSGPKTFWVKGLNFRVCPTENAALEEALIRLKVTCRQRPDQLSEEQLQARDDYMRALGYYEHAKQLIDWGVMTDGDRDTNDMIDLDARRQNVQECYNLCVQLGLYYAGSFESSSIGGLHK